MVLPIMCERRILGGNLREDEGGSQRGDRKPPQAVTRVGLSVGLTSITARQPYSVTLFARLMNRFRPSLLPALVGTVLLAACGTPGPPLPPSLELPKPVTDLRAARRGDKVYLAWSPPTQTTERQTIR